MFRLKHLLSGMMMAAALTVVFLTPLAARAQSEEQELQPQEQAAETGLAVQQEASQDPTMVGPLVWTPLATINPVKGTDGRIHLIYELHVSNASHYNVRIRSIEVLNGRDNSVTGVNRVFSADGQDVTGKIRPFSLEQQTQEAADYTNRLGPGQGGVVYFDVTYGSLRDVPKNLKHRFIASFPVPNQDPQVYTVIDEGTKVSGEEALVIAPPLKGANWVVANGSGPIITAHRYTTQPTNGGLRIPEHFAIDFIQLDAQGRAFVGDPSDVKNYPYYGAEIVSVAPGKVVEVLNDLKDQIPGQPRTGLKPDEYAGNHVIVEMGKGRYALYAHLIPGSVAVSEGDYVQQGQLLGKLGNSGNSDAPHLHFHVMDSASALNTRGLPFSFNRMAYQGQFMGAFDDVVGALFTGKQPTFDARGAGMRALQMPLSLNLIGFK